MRGFGSRRIAAQAFRLSFLQIREFGLSGQKAGVRAWYDGFTFGRRTDIYNPWSILNFLDKGEFAPYWANTSENGLISHELRIADNKIKHRIEGLLNGDSVKTVPDEQVIFSQLNENAGAIWNLFLASGYLRIQERAFNGAEYEYTLTNYEVLSNVQVSARAGTASAWPLDRTYTE